MVKMIQVRNLPEPLYRQLKLRATDEGLSMSDFVRRELSKALDHPPRQQVLARLSRRRRGPIQPSAAAIIRRERERR